MINLHPRYQRTHVNTHAMYLTLSYLFDDLHLVRVQYDAVTFNEASIRAAKRFGFVEEGIGRNLGGVVPSQKLRLGSDEVKALDAEGPALIPLGTVGTIMLSQVDQPLLGSDSGDHPSWNGEIRSQDLWLSAMTDYDWKNGGKERLKKMIERPPVDTTKL